MGTGTVVYADLHTHSTFSDGTRSPEENVALAKELGLEAVAVTDHDNLEGARAALGKGRELGISVIPGVEISTQTEGRDVHLLGYFVDLDDEGLSRAFQDNAERRTRRVCAIADKLADAGYCVSGREMLASGETPNRSNLARRLVELGCARDIDDAFDRLIGKNSPYYVPNSYLPTAEAIALVREAGGYPFIAHPAHYHVVDLIAPLRAEGLFGLEAWHTLQTPKETRELVRCAGELGLAISGGSDWHGDSAHGARLGGAGLSQEHYDAFLRACGRL